jgi:TATA-binding protein-associated factor Taf7
MARGFESKDVEFQQAEAERRPAAGRPLTAEERDEAERRRSIELALARSRADLEKATSKSHREMLQQAINELEARLGLA